MSVALVCPLHGLSFLSRAEVRAQKLEENHRWRCPRCDLEAEFAEYADRLVQNGCIQCKAKLLHATLIYDGRHIAMFCSAACQDEYLARLDKEKRRYQFRGN